MNNVYDNEKTGSENSLESRSMPGGISHDEENDMERNAYNSVAEDIAKREGFYNEKSDNNERKTKSSSADQLKKAELASDAAVLGSEAGFYNEKSAGNELGVGGRLKNMFWGSRRRKQISVGGGMTGIALGGGIFLLTFVGGTGFEFIHMAQLLEHAHLSNHQAASNQETGKLYRFLNTADVGETRLTFLESKYKTVMLQQLDDIGLKPVFGKGTTFNGFQIDRLNPDSPYAGLNSDQINSKLADLGITDGITYSPDGSTVTVTPENGFLNSYSSKKLTLRALVAHMDEAGVPDAIRWRILARYGFVTWHPLKIIKGNINTKINQAALDAWKAAKDKFLSNGQNPVSLDDQAAKSKANASNDSTTTPAGGTDVGPIDTGKTKTALAGLKNSTTLKVAGGVAFVVGLACTIQTVDKQFGTIRYAQNILPMMRLGSSVITTGNQIMNGGDVNPNEMNILAQQFSQSGVSGADWSDSQAIQADSGQPMTGQDVNKGVKDSLNTTAPVWLDWVNYGVVAPVLNTLCTGVGSAITGIGSFALGIFSGDVLGTVLGFFGSYLAGPYIGDLSSFLAGNAVDVVHAVGPTFGSYADYGAAFFANAGAVQDGGAALTPGQVGELNGEQNLETQKTFDTKSIAYKLFNRTDYNSLISRVMDSQTPSVTQNLANMVSGLFKISSDLISSPLKLLSIGVSAAPQSTSYNYPFPQFGFSQEDLDKFSNISPYTNANDVGSILDNNQNGNPDYIGLARQCFNVNISKDTSGESQGKWSVTPGATSDPTQLNYYDSTYSSLNCNDPGGVDPNTWLKLRFFIFDSGLMEGYACQKGDSQSCSSDGFGSSSNTTNPPPSTPSNSPSSGSCSGGGKYTALVSSGSSFAGVDQGIDFVPSSTSGYSICAPAPGTITLADQTGHQFNRTSGKAEIIEQLDQSPNAPSSSQFIYYAEIIQINSNIHVGVHVNKGDVIGQNAQSPGIEVGWGLNSTHGFMCPIGYPTACGTSFNNWIKGL